MPAWNVFGKSTPLRAAPVARRKGEWRRKRSHFIEEVGGGRPAAAPDQSVHQAWLTVPRSGRVGWVAWSVGNTVCCRDVGFAIGSFARKAESNIGGRRQFRVRRHLKDVLQLFRGC